MLEVHCLNAHWQSSYIHFSRTHINSLWFPQTKDEGRMQKEGASHIFTPICHLLTASATQINMYSYSWGNVCVLSTCGYLVQLITNKSKLRAFLLNQWLKVHRNTFGNKNTQNEKLFNSRSCWITKYKSIHIIHYNRFYTHITCYTMLNLPVWPFPSEIRERRNYMSNKCGYVDRQA